MRTLSASFHLFSVNTFSVFSMNHFSLCFYSNASLHAIHCSLTMPNVIQRDNGKQPQGTQTSFFRDSQLTNNKLARRYTDLFRHGQPTYRQQINHKVHRPPSSVTANLRTTSQRAQIYFVRDSQLMDNKFIQLIPPLYPSYISLFFWLPCVTLFRSPCLFMILPSSLYLPVSLSPLPLSLYPLPSSLSSTSFFVLLLTPDYRCPIPSFILSSWSSDRL